MVGSVGPIAPVFFVIVLKTRTQGALSGVGQYILTAVAVPNRFNIAPVYFVSRYVLTIRTYMSECQWAMPALDILEERHKRFDLEKKTIRFDMYRIDFFFPDRVRFDSIWFKKFEKSIRKI